MKVLFISHKYPPGVGGMQRQSYELIQGVGKHHDVFKIVFDESKESKIRFFWKLKSRVKDLMRDNPGIQIVHCNDGVCAFFCRWIKKQYNIPVVLTFHGLDLLWPNRIYQNALPSLSKNFDAAICVSDFTAEECKKRGFARNKVHVVYNGVDSESEFDTINVDNTLLNQFKALKREDKKILISIGRPVRRKGFSWFVQHVMPQLGDRYHYIMIGPGTLFKTWQKALFKLLPPTIMHQLNLFFGWSSDQYELIRLAQNENYAKYFSWYHKLSYDSILFALNQSDLFVMPNIKVRGDAEGFGLVALESNIQSRYVMASGIEGIVSAVHDKRNGSLLESEDGEAWYKAIKSYFELDHDLREAKEKTARRYTEKTFSWGKMVEGYIQVFEKIV